jgi:hypothetical protein
MLSIWNNKMKNSAFKTKSLKGVKGKLLQKGGRKNYKDLPKVENNEEMTAASKKKLNNAVKLAKIEKYAKEHNITITQAMVHFM